MAKKKQKETISWHPDAKTRAMQAELHAWMVKHELTHDTKWWTPDEFYDGKHLEFDEPPHLVLTFEGDLNNLFWCPRDDDWDRDRRNEFESIVERHNYWYEFEDCVTMCFMPIDA